jgi:hypothetical protein
MKRSQQKAMFAKLKKGQRVIVRSKGVMTRSFTVVKELKDGKHVLVKPARLPGQQKVPTIKLRRDIITPTTQTLRFDFSGFKKK